MPCQSQKSTDTRNVGPPLWDRRQVSPSMRLSTASVVAIQQHLASFGHEKEIGKMAVDEWGSSRGGRG